MDFFKENQPLAFLAGLFLFATHYFQTNLGGSDLALPFNLMVWCFISLQISYGLVLAAKEQRLKVDSLSKVLIAMLCLLSIPLLYPDAPYSDFAIPRLLAIAGLIAFYISLNQLNLTDRHLSILLDLIICAAAIQMLVSLAQLWLLPQFELAWYKSPDRPSAVFQQPNVAASLYTTAILLSFIKINFYPCNRVKFNIYLLLIAVASFLIICLAARSSWLALLIALPCLSYLCLIKTRCWKKTVLPCVGLFCGLALGYLWAINQPVAELLTTKASDLGARKVDYYYASKMIIANIWTGVGYGNFEGGFRFFWADAYAKGDTFGFISSGYAHPHNEILFWLAEGGIITLIPFALFAVFCVKHANQHNLHWLIACLPILIHSQLEYPFYHSITHAVILVLLLWIFNRQSHLASISTLPIHPSALTIPALMLSILLIPFMLTGLHSHALMMTYKLSSEKSLSHFQSLINPLVLGDAYYFEVLTFRANKGIKQANSNELLPLEAWADKTLYRAPRSTLIENQLKIKQALNKKGEHQKLALLYQYWYPDLH